MIRYSARARLPLLIR